MRGEAFLRWYDWAARLDFARTLVSLVVSIVTGAVVYLDGWDPPMVLLAMLIGGAAAAVIYLGFCGLWDRHAPMSRREEREGPPAVKQNREPTGVDFDPDIDASAAFYDILANSDWSQQQRSPDHPTRDWLTLRLGREIHNLLRQGKLTAWGYRCLTNTVEAPESEIPAGEWENIEIDFAPLAPDKSRTSAMHRIRKAGFNTVYAGVRFSREQIYGRFPLILVPPKEQDTLPAWPNGLNVSKIWFQTPDLEARGFIHINIDVFNGTGEEIFLRSIDGQIQVNQGSFSAGEKPLTKLVTPHFFSARQNHFDAYQSFSFILEQELPRYLVEKFLNWESGINYVFDFDKLNVWAQSTQESGKLARLPLWDAASLVKTGNGIAANYVARLWADRPWRIPLRQ